jgi:hypothetical protein
MTMRLRPLLLVASLAGCRGPDRSFEDLHIVAAELDDVKLGTVAAMFGWTQGTATLTVTDTQDGVHVLPVTLEGACLGVVVEGLVVPDGGSADFELGGADEFPVPGLDFMRRYHGSRGSLVLGLGVDAGVKLDRAWFSLGIGMFVGFEWLSIRADPDPEDTAEDTSEDTGFEDTGAG